MLAYTLFGFVAGYALFLLGFAIFMYFENQKFGDNQFTVKLLPPPPASRTPAREAEAVSSAGSATGAGLADWTAVPAASARPHRIPQAGDGSASPLRAAPSR